MPRPPRSGVDAAGTAAVLVVVMARRGNQSIAPAQAGAVGPDSSGQDSRANEFAPPPPSAGMTHGCHSRETAAQDLSYSVLCPCEKNLPPFITTRPRPSRISFM